VRGQSGAGGWLAIMLLHGAREVMTAPTPRGIVTSTWNRARGCRGHPRMSDYLAGRLTSPATARLPDQLP